MNKFFPLEIKIPTILGLSVLVAGLVVGILLVTQNQLFSLKTKAAKPLLIEKVTVANITANSASIYWQTDQPTSGFIQAGQTNSLGLTFKDERDPQAPKPHHLHFATLTNLNPDTTYFYKINSGANVYPQNSPLSFKTAKATASQDAQSSLNYGQPLIGTIVYENLQPVTEALVLLEIPGAQNLATITKIVGNFILPLANVYNQPVDNNTPLSATITVFDLQKSSKATLHLPIKTVLPPIVLGQDIDLTLVFASSSAQAKQQQTSYDLNKDGVVNSLDLSLLIKNLGPNSKLKEADFNQDGIVDQKDINLMSPYIPNVAPKK